MEPVYTVVKYKSNDEVIGSLEEFINLYAEKQRDNGYNSCELVNAYPLIEDGIACYECIFVTRWNGFAHKK